MTSVGSIILVIACIGIGYVLEPVFFSGMGKRSNTSPGSGSGETNDEGGLTGNILVPSVISKPAGKVSGGAGGASDAGLSGQLSQIILADYPEWVELKVRHSVVIEASNSTLPLKYGTKVKPLRLEGNMLVFCPLVLPVESKIEVSKTNFVELAMPRMMARLKKGAAQENLEPSLPAPPVDADPQPEPVLESGSEPVLEPVPESDPVGGKLDEAAIVSLMKEDVAAGKVTEFKMSQVTAWKAGSDMEFDGGTYQTGRVTFKAETILGVQEHEAVALIEGGKVYKWMWAKTKLEMR